MKKRMMAIVLSLAMLTSLPCYSVTADGVNPESVVVVSEDCADGAEAAETDLEENAVEVAETTSDEADAEAASEAGTEVQTEAASEAGTEAQTETASEAGTEAQTEAAVEASTEAQTEAAAEAGTEAQTEAAPEAGTEAQTEAASETGTEVQTEAAEANTEAETSAEVEAGAEAETEFAAELSTETETETAAEANAETETESAAEANVEAETESAAEANVEAETESAAEVSAEAATETQSDDGIMVSSVEDAASDAQSVATTTTTELEVNKTYYISDILNTTQYFTVSGAGRVQFILENCTYPSSYTLYMHGTGLIGTNDSYQYNSCELKLITDLEGATSYYATLPEGKQYNFKLSGSTAKTNSEATLYIKYEAAGTYNGETESNDSFDTANQISLNTQYDAAVSYPDEYDYFRFTLSASSKVSISYGFYDESYSYDYLYAYLYSEDSNGNTTCLYYDRISCVNSSYATSFSDLRLPAGNYFIVVNNYSSYYVPYNVTVTSTAESSSSYEIEKNDLTSQANSKSVNTWYTGNINIYKSNGGSSDIDWFSYKITEKCYLTVELKTPRQSSGTVTATLYKLSGSELTEVTTITSGSDAYLASETLFCKSGTYYLKMSGSSADWDYSVSLTKEKYVALTEITLPTTKSIKVGSTATLKASLAPTNASEKGLTWTSSNTKVATVDENGKVTAVKSGKTTITVKSSFSDTSKIKATCTVYVTTPVTLKISSATNTSSGIKLTWTKVSGADGYYIYRRTNSGKYSSTPTKTIKSGSTVSWTDTSIKSKNGTTYVYKVVPYSDYIAGSGTGKKITRLTGTSLSSLSSSAVGKLTVKWKKASSVSGYQIQYSTSKKFTSGNKTKLVSGKSKSSYTLTGLTAGTTYYVRIRTYKTVSGKKYYSAWSSANSKKVKNLTASYSYSKTDKSKTYGNVKANVYYQKVVLKGSSSAIKKINSSIESDMKSFLNSSNRDSLYEYAKTGNEAGCKDSYYYTATSTVTYNNNGIISIKVKTYWYAGGVSNTDVYGLTYDLSTGKKLSLVNVCSGGSAAIEEAVLAEAEDSYIPSSGVATVEDYSAKNMSFYLKSNYKAVVCFAPYELDQGGAYISFEITSKYK
ncbi:MAG: Ig-like domain-containing protein [Clostridiales bacterium]|nr:Ig-like domain-containing protein [Clostridiales bacterium]